MAARKLKNPVTEDHANLFRVLVRKWQEKLNLMDWRVERSTKKTRAMADVMIDASARLACYRLGDFGSAPINEDTLEELAIHELLHVMLTDFKVICQSNASTEEQLCSAEHSVINRLEKLLFQLR